MPNPITAILSSPENPFDALEHVEVLPLILVVVIGIVIVAIVTALAPKVGVAGPLVLVTLGIAFSLLDFTPNIYLPPEWILAGILPPLLYAAAVSLPAMEFRRDLGAIGGLSVVLVLISSVVLGLVFTVLIPGLGLPLGIALGAILSPTDAVATSIVKKLGISPRIVTMLEGESLLNDATALVLLKTAVAAVAGAFSIWAGIGSFSWSVLLAVAVGLVVGWVNLRVRAWIPNTAAATAISFVVPYVAYLPAEHFHASGLVAAVVAGIVTGQGAARHFTAEQRLSDRVTWRTIELMLEGGVFLLMGLEVTSVISLSDESLAVLWHALWISAIAVAIILGLRTLYVIPLVYIQGRRAKRAETVRPHLEQARTRFQNVTADDIAVRTGGRGDPERRLSSFRRRIARSIGDAQYLEDTRLGWREGSIIVWAGMRGAVTLAAAQTLPTETPHRSLLILIAFIVAVGTLVVQGSTVGPLTKKLGLAGSKDDQGTNEELAELNELLRQAGSKALEKPDLHRPNGEPFDPELIRTSHTRLTMPPDEAVGAAMDEFRELRLLIIQAERQKLAAARANGRFSTATLRRVLESLDAEELSIRAHLAD